jgi:SpoVK/Ycf46/Vps4 family AAA+-type ATPase
LHVGPPDKDERRVLVERFVSTAVQNSAGESDVLLESSLDAIALASAGLSRANVIGVCREAIMNAIRENDVATKLETRHVLELLQ